MLRARAMPAICASLVLTGRPIVLRRACHAADPSPARPCRPRPCPVPARGDSGPQAPRPGIREPCSGSASSSLSGLRRADLLHERAKSRVSADRVEVGRGTLEEKVLVAVLVRALEPAEGFVVLTQADVDLRGRRRRDVAMPALCLEQRDDVLALTERLRVVFEAQRRKGGSHG